jgi:hypothetical protein
MRSSKAMRINKTAEDQFREAFIRLKTGAPKNLPPGTIVSQNNVSREAGCDPSALRKNRYPGLIGEIQEHVLCASSPVESSSLRAGRSRPDFLSEKVVQLQSDRDHLMSLLLEADSTILQLTIELAQHSKHLPDR